MEACITQYCARIISRIMQQKAPAVSLKSEGVTEQIVGAMCERLERATMMALDSIVFFPASI
jgi:hypothetical protein